MAREPEKERLVADSHRPPPPQGIFRITWIVPLLFVATIITALMVMMKESEAPTYVRYSTVTGYFQQDDPATNPNGFDYTTTNFGLINREYDIDTSLDSESNGPQWQRFSQQVARLNEDSGSRFHYKVLFLGRHGEGYHNVAESFYGTAAWDCYWSLLDGNSTSTWADARLTLVGEAEARKANAFWSSLISREKIPTPESYYVSPLMRCCETAKLTFEGLDLGNRPFKPIIKEGLREAIGAHTCDRRSTKTEIEKAFPGFVFEKDFEERDPLWKSDLRETDSSQDVRSKAVLDEVFSSDENTYISISSHSGEIGSILRVLSHRPFGLGTGQAIPVLVKAEVVDGTAPAPNPEPWQPVEKCTSPPPMPTL